MPRIKIYAAVVALTLLASLAALYFSYPLTSFFLFGVIFALLLSQVFPALNPAAHASAQELQLAKQKIHIAENRYEVIVSNIAALIVIKNNANQILFASPYSVVLSGYQSQELTSKRLAELVPDTHSELFERAYKIASLGEPFSFQHPLRHKSGVQLWVDSRIAPIESDDGSIEGTLTIMLDATATARYQHQIEAYASELRDVSSMISHDLKSPIATIRGMTNILETEKESISADGQEALHHIGHATNTMELLVKEILTYFKSVSDDINHETFNLSDVCESVRADLKGLLNSVSGEIKVQATDLHIQSDRVKMYQIISNLVSNGLKYQSKERTPIVTIDILQKDDGISLIIKDNGAGIPAEKINHIFRPYVRLPGVTAEGHGLGLATVKKLVERLKGTIAVQSTVGSGSTFTINFTKES